MSDMLLRRSVRHDFMKMTGYIADACEPATRFVFEGRVLKDYRPWCKAHAKVTPGCKYVACVAHKNKCDYSLQDQIYKYAPEGEPRNTVMAIRVSFLTFVMFTYDPSTREFMIITNDDYDCYEVNGIMDASTARVGRMPRLANAIDFMCGTHWTDVTQRFYECMRDIFEHELEVYLFEVNL